MKKQFGMAALSLTILTAFPEVFAGEFFTGTWYVHKEESFEQPDFWEELKLLQRGTHICGEWSTGAKLRQRIDEGYVVGSVNNNKAKVIRCAYDDAGAPPSPTACPKFSKKWRDVFVRRGEQIMIGQIGKDGSISFDGVLLSRTSKEGAISEDTLRACRQWTGFKFRSNETSSQ